MLDHTQAPVVLSSIMVCVPGIMMPVKSSVVTESSFSDFHHTRAIRPPSVVPVYRARVLGPLHGLGPHHFVKPGRAPHLREAISSNLSCIEPASPFDREVDRCRVTGEKHCAEQDPHLRRTRTRRWSGGCRPVSTKDAVYEGRKRVAGRKAGFAGAMISPGCGRCRTGPCPTRQARPGPKQSA